LNPLRLLTGVLTGIVFGEIALYAFGSGPGLGRRKVRLP
jgi:hypothetical protein